MKKYENRTCIKCFDEVDEESPITNVCSKCCCGEEDAEQDLPVTNCSLGEKRVQQMRDWRKKHPEYYKTRNRNKSQESQEMNSIRWKTIRLFKHLKDNGKCEECPSTKNLKFHHLEPYAYDNFRLLCIKCHRRIHERVLVEMNDILADKEEQGGVSNGR